MYMYKYTLRSTFLGDLPDARKKKKVKSTEYNTDSYIQLYIHIYDTKANMCIIGTMESSCTNYP